MQVASASFSTLHKADIMDGCLSQSVLSLCLLWWSSRPQNPSPWGDRPTISWCFMRAAVGVRSIPVLHIESQSCDEQRAVLYVRAP